MNELNYTISQLLIKELKQELPPAGKSELQAWLESSPEHQLLFDRLNNEQAFRTDISAMADINTSEARQRVMAVLFGKPVLKEEQFNAGLKFEADDLALNTYSEIPVHSTRFLKTEWFRYAAVLLLIAGTAAYFYINYGRPQQQTTRKQLALLPDIPPGGNKASLILADGSTIVLDSAAIGSLARQGNTNIIKLDAGKLAYNGGKEDGETMYNTVSTPKGGQYQIVLPDGSKVWLNATSSITFPTAFAKDRKVTVTGEVYFEVIVDKKKPFIVSANEVKIQVLGTSFNINSYTTEPGTKTTLVTGSISVAKGADQVLLKPGQQAITRPTNKITMANAVDLEKVMAWKNGIFNFENAGLEEIMRQLSRWYDIEVVYEKNIPDTKFGGKMMMNMELSGVLNALKVSGIHFRLEGRRLVVLPSP